MSVKWAVFVLMAWIIVSLLVGVAENVMVGGGTDPETGLPVANTVLNDLASCPTITAPTLGAKITSAFTDAKFWSAMGQLATFDFKAIFCNKIVSSDGKITWVANQWAVFQWVFFLPFSLGFGICLLLAVTRGVSSG
jgi:hypothetical protein